MYATHMLVQPKYISITNEYLSANWLSKEKMTRWFCLIFLFVWVNVNTFSHIFWLQSYFFFSTGSFLKVVDKMVYERKAWKDEGGRYECNSTELSCAVLIQLSQWIIAPLLEPLAETWAEIRVILHHILDQTGQMTQLKLHMTLPLLDRSSLLGQFKFTSI